MLQSVDVILNGLAGGGSQKDFCKSDKILSLEGCCGNVKADLQGAGLGAGRPVRRPQEGRQCQGKTEQEIFRILPGRVWEPSKPA